MATAVFAAALLALPAIAHADTVKITDDDLVDGVYTITKAGDYELDTDNCTGINVGKDGLSLTSVEIDLKGKTISNSDDHSCVHVIGNLQTDVTIKNGALVQTNASNAALRVDSNGGSSPDVALINMSASSADHQCIDVQNGRVNINEGNGTFSTTGSTSVLRCSTSGTIEVHGGSFEGTSITGENRYEYQLYGGTYSSFPEGSLYGSKNGFFCNSEGKFEVKSVSSFEKDANYILEYKEGAQTYPIYFATKDDANKFKDTYGESVVSGVQDAWFDVTFKAEGGTPASTTQKVFYGTSPEKAETPQKDDGVFSHWAKADGNKYEYDELYEATTLTAVWNDYVAQVGDKKFTSLQGAVDAIEDGSAKASEIKILKDLTENVTVSKGDFTLDLNGKTLNAKDSEAVITVSGPATLSIENGTISSEDVDSDGISVTDADADVTLKDLTIQDVYTAVKASAGKVTIDKGFVGKSDSETLHVSGSAKLTIEDGTFSSTSNDFLYIEDPDEQGSVAINGGEFSGMWASTDFAAALDLLKINGGIFEDWENVCAVADGKTFLEREDGRFEVVDAAGVKAQASWVVSTSASYEGDEFEFKVYFRDETNARECYKKMGEEIPDGNASIKAIYHLEFVSQDKTVEVRGLEEGGAVGELPAGKEIAKYEFLGWYLNGNYSDDYKLSADTVLEHDSKAVALWKKVDTDEATSDPIEIEEADESKSSSSDSDSSDSKSSPETGDAGVAALGFAALGSAALAVAARRRKAE